MTPPVVQPPATKRRLVPPPRPELFRPRPPATAPLPQPRLHIHPLPQPPPRHRPNPRRELQPPRMLRPNPPKPDDPNANRLHDDRFYVGPRALCPPAPFRHPDGAESD